MPGYGTSTRPVPLIESGVKVFGIAGWSGSGKTILITALIPIFQSRGLTVSTIKHAHHNAVMDQPGKDSFRHAEAGAAEVILASEAGYALFHRQRRTPELAALLARLAPVDLVLVEGFKADPIPKLEVYRPALGHRPLWQSINITMVASDQDLPDCHLPVLKLDDPAGIADTIASVLGLNELTTF